MSEDSIDRSRVDRFLDVVFVAFPAAALCLIALGCLVGLGTGLWFLVQGALAMDTTAMGEGAGMMILSAFASVVTFFGGATIMGLALGKIG